MCLLRQESQYIGDGPFLVGAVLKGQVESGLGPFVRHQLQTMLRVNVLDRTTLKKRKELSQIMEYGGGEGVTARFKSRKLVDLLLRGGLLLHTFHFDLRTFVKT